MKDGYECDRCEGGFSSGRICPTCLGKGYTTRPSEKTVFEMKTAGGADPLPEADWILTNTVKDDDA